MKCDRCNVVLVKGIALVPVWCRSDGKPSSQGDTLGPYMSAFASVDKCPTCGKSFGKFRYV